MQRIWKRAEKKSTRQVTVRESRQVRRDTEETGEDGLGAELSISRQLRVRPLKRDEGTVTGFPEIATAA